MGVCWVGAGFSAVDLRFRGWSGLLLRLRSDIITGASRELGGGGMMAVMTVQPPLPLAPGGVRVGDAAPCWRTLTGVGVRPRGAVVRLGRRRRSGSGAGRGAAGAHEGRDRGRGGGRVRDGRETLRRWVTGLGVRGRGGGAGQAGPEGPVEGRPELAEQMRDARAAGATLEAVADRFGVSTASVRRAEQPTAGTSEPEPRPTRSPRCTSPPIRGLRRQIRGTRRGLSRCPWCCRCWPTRRRVVRSGLRPRAGLLTGAAPVFTPSVPGCRWRGCSWRCPRWREPGATGGRTGSTPGRRAGSTVWTRCCSRPCSAPWLANPAPRGPPGSASRGAGRGTGHGPGPGGQDDPPTDRRARRPGAGRQLQAAVAGHTAAAAAPDRTVGGLRQRPRPRLRAPGDQAHSARLRFPPRPPWRPGCPITAASRSWS